MGLPNEKIVNAIVLMAAGYQHGLTNQRMKGIGDFGLERQKPCIMNPAWTAAAGPGRPSPR